MIALIDGDVVVHRCGYVSENDPEAIAKYRANDMIEIMLAETNATGYEIYLSDSAQNNFRYAVDPTYKGNRKAPKPKHYQALKDFLLESWEANVSLGMEADDSLGIRQTEELRKFDPDPAYWAQTKFLPTVICSVDKDLLQIPGNHFNFVKKEFCTIDYVEGCRQLYRQMLIGDPTDNVRGVDKIGKVKAGKLIDPLEDELDMFNVVRPLYNDDERLLKNGRLLYIRREDNEVWQFPDAGKQGQGATNSLPS